MSYESLIDIDKRNNTAVILEKYFWDMQGAEEYVSIVDTPPAVYKNLDLPDISQLNTIIPTKLLPIKDFIVNAKKYTKINQEIFPSALYDLHPIIDLIIAYDVAEILDAHRTYDSVDELNAVWLKILTRHQKEQMSITQSEEKTKLTGIDTSGLSVGMVVKNYKQLCEILKKETKTGNARKAQLKEFGRYFDWEKAGQKFIITDIYDTPLEKEDKRKFGNNSIYVRYIEVILLKYLSQQTGYTRTLTKRKWWELLGIVNSKYSRVSSKELEDLDYSVTAWEIKNFYQRCNKKLEEILFSALNSLKSRKLITYEIQTIIVKRDDKGREIYSEADDNEKKMLLDVEHYVLADSFNISDKSVLKNLNKQLNNMVSSLGKTWNGSKFDFGKATGFYSGLDGMAKTIATNSKLVKSATGYYDDFYNYFKNKKIYVSDDLKKALGGDTYKELLQNNIGKITKDAKKGMELNDALGTAVDNGDNISNLNKSIKAQEDTYNQLTKKLNEYQAEVNSQLSSGLLKQGSEAYQEAMKNIQDFSAKIYDASKELIELQDKLNQIKIDTIQNVIDAFERRTSKLDKYASLLESQDKEVPESVYQEQIDTNNAQVQKNQEQRNLLLEQQSVYDVNSSRYKELAEDINKLDESTLGLLEDNEKLKDSIYELRISNLEKAIQGYDDLEDELKDFRSLLNDDAFLDKNGAITDEGLAQITLLSQSLGNVKKKISDLTTGLSKLTEMYNNGLISLDEYNDKSSEYRKEIRSATSDVKDYQDSLVSLYTDALKAEVDALDKVIDKRREAYKQQREYADYQKKVNSQQKDVNSIKAQIQAMENSSDAATLARVKKLKQDLADAEDDLNTTKQDHKDDLIDQGFQKMSDDLNQMLEDTEYEISHNADKQNEIIQSMLNKQVGMYQEAYSKINSIIKNTGWVGSNDFNNNQSQMSSQTGAQNQASNASQSQQTANSKPSSSASGTDTSGIKDNASKNDKITENIMKPENTTNRPVAELTVSKSSVSIEEGKSTSVTTKIRPNDAANKKLSWKSSNTAIAAVSNGTISGKKPGSCQITVSTTDGSGISKTIAVTVTKKPDPPKPAIPSNKGGDGVPRVGDVVTFNGKYYYDSWGKRPAGSLYSGVKNGVVIDSYSSKDFGGNARYTGDLKVHIKSRDGRYRDLGWVRLNQISGYAKGTSGVDRDQIAIVDEEGRELQIPNGKGGRITKLEKGTGVIPHTATEKLMALSEQLDNNGNMVINGRTIEEYVNDMANMQSIAVPDFSDVTASVVSQLEGKGMGNVTVEYNQPVTFNSVDKNDIPQMEEFLKRAREDTTKYIVKELRKGGMQIRR